ncbi:MAG: tetratricopeptide repeat protein [Anaerolineae bacterium]|nr:tetratricopeptide repeat protein [Anaerolineae bacterium]
MPFLFILLLLGVGLAIYTRGRFSLGNRVVSGSRARSIGCLLMLPMPLALSVMICWTTSMVGQYGSVEALQQAILTDPSIRDMSALIELGALFACVALATWLTFNASAASSLEDNANAGFGTRSHQTLTLRQAAGYSHLTENQLMMLIRANAIDAERSVDGYRIAPKVLERWMYMERGVTQFNRRAYVEAIQDFSRALYIDPKAAEAYAWRGLAFLRAGRMGDGLQDFRYALAQTQDNEIRRKYTQWLNAPNSTPAQITGRNPITERIVTDWLAGTDTVDQEAGREPFSDTVAEDAPTAAPYVPSSSDDNETMRT